MLTDDQLTHFHDKGWVRLSPAFAPEAALEIQNFMWDQLGQLHGIDRSAPETWRQSWSGLNKKTRHPVYQQVGNPTLWGAVDQLLGPDNWNPPSGWGGFLVSPPDADESPWDVTDHFWHWDGNPAAPSEQINSLFTLTLYSAIAPGGGGTLLLEGSHRLIKPFFAVHNDGSVKRKALRRLFCQSHPWLAELSGYAPDQGDRMRRFMEEGTIIDGVPVRVVEATGEPGDAILCYSCIFHTRSHNRAQVPRFMRVCGIGKKGKKEEEE
ncbi:MAG: hypothetical protein GKR89_22700 [Candidatus Latescibacteria bacterium]|nr:hypothetical protein [Candidatus Latescibacterota bacterium]